MEKNKTQILLTGATGVLGSSLLPVFIKNNVNVTCLIRAQDSQHLLQRSEKVKQFLTTHYGSLNFDKVQFLPGDIEKPFFGMIKKDFGNVANETTHVFHCAADLDFLMAPALATSKVLLAIDNIFTLMAQSSNRNIKVEYVSTVGVGGKQKNPLHENRMTEPVDFFNSYEQAKFTGEQILYKKMDEGFAITIHRPSMIVGHSQTGAVIRRQIFYFLLKILAGSMTKGIYPTGFNAILDTIPCDEVAQALWLSSQNKASTGRIFHLSSGPQNSMKVSQIQDLAKQAWSSSVANQNKKSKMAIIPKGIPLPLSLLSGAHFLSQVIPKESPWKKRLELLPMITEYSLQIQQFENYKTQEFFSSLNFEFQKPSAYLPPLIRDYFGATQY